MDAHPGTNALTAAPPTDLPPMDGRLPDAALRDVASGPLSVYVHVPFCAHRCGYCDFNTYTAAELGSAPGASQQAYLDAVRRELDLAVSVLGPDLPQVQTVFFGGGTPTLLPADQLAGVVQAIRDRFSVASDAEITTEANPESVDDRYLATLVEAGINRLSLGMQSAVGHVLAVLERRHSPGRAEQAVAWARRAGFDSISLDLIYGTPGETLTDWRTSVQRALASEPDHVSAYALTLEPGTRMAARIRRGDLPTINDDDLADKYALADDMLTAAGFPWYEISNWARPGHACRHNHAYWQGGSWWGIGPGAHSHVGGVRWWNVAHPRTYAARLANDQSPAQARETLSGAERRMERVLLETRLASGLDLDVLTPTERTRVSGIVDTGRATLDRGRLVLTRSGRLLADGVIRDLLD